MTFSILGTDASGAVGIALSSSSPAVAARCAHLRAGVGGAASQNITDPRLGSTMLDAMAAGARPAEVLAGLGASNRDIEYRQLSAINVSGETAVFRGEHSLGVVSERRGQAVVAAGNLLARPSVIDSMVDTFLYSEGELEERLLQALEAGVAAGGEAGPVRSAGLQVVRIVPWPETDLRVDWHDEPVRQLRTLLELWLPQRDDYVVRAMNPASAPSYGVPGDE